MWGVGVFVGGAQGFSPLQEKSLCHFLVDSPGVRFVLVAWAREVDLVFGQIPYCDFCVVLMGVFLCVRADQTMPSGCACVELVF